MITCEKTIQPARGARYLHVALVCGEDVVSRSLEDLADGRQGDVTLIGTDELRLFECSTGGNSDGLGAGGGRRCFCHVDVYNRRCV